MFAESTKAELNKLLLEESVDTNELPSTAAEKEPDQEQEMYTSTVRPGQITNGERASELNLVVWVSNWRSDQTQQQLISHQCHEQNHISPKCQLQFADMAHVTKNLTMLDLTMPYEKPVETNSMKDGNETKDENSQGKQHGDLLKYFQ